MTGLSFIVKMNVAPAGVIAHLYVQGLTEDVWKAYISVDPPGRYLQTGKWSRTEEDARYALVMVMEKEIKKWEGHRDPRPSQVRRLEVLKMALDSICPCGWQGSW